jgi:hypothetical protein
VIQVLQNSFLSAKESDITKFTVHEWELLIINGF